MRLSERVYRRLLVAYPVEHRRRYGDSMTQLFRDRMRQEGGGFSTVLVWGHIGFDLVRSAFTERMETAMNLQTWTSRWWEATVVVLAAFISVIAIFFADTSPGWALLIGSADVLLIGGLALRSAWRVGATAMVIAGCLLAAVPFWGIFNVVLAVVIVVGGLETGKIGPDPAKATEAAT